MKDDKMNDEKRWGKASRLFLLSFILLIAHPALAKPEPQHCIPLYGECKYKPDFKHFEYVNPDAPKGGTIKLAETGTFDNVNPLILKGVKAPAITTIFESLMTPSLDEPSSMYGLLAESVVIAEDKTWAEFTLRREAKWADGTPVTPDDVVFSLDTIKEKADPSYRIVFTPVVKAEKTGERTVKFTFSDPNNRELPTMVAGMPVISKAYYTTHEFDKTTLEPPLTSAPYLIDTVDAGKRITYKRNPEYWGKDLAVNRGQFNFDVVRIDMYRDENVTLEALKSGAYDFRREYIARNWATGYDAPAVHDGRIIKRDIPDVSPQGMQGFILNSRKFPDRRVREAIGLTMDYEWLNKTIFFGAYKRNTSFFKNTEFEAKGIPEGKELALLAPYNCHSERAEGESKNLKDPSAASRRDSAQDDRYCLTPALFTTPFAVPVTDGSGNNREHLLKAQKLLEEAGWTVKEGKRVNDKGEQLHVEFMLRQPTMERVAAPMRKNLERLGISSALRNVDDSQYQKRVDEGDYDIISIWINRSVFYPGNEQYALWHSSQADVKGSNNVAGVKNPAVDAALNALLSAKTEEELQVAGRALDRILLWEHYVIPHWHSGSFRVAYWNKFGLPAVLPKYNVGLQTWWIKEKSSQ
ncbi:MAG: extracellular solute-binding protein [Alphaproteobacteria bacterium]